MARHEGKLSVLDHGGQLGRYETVARLALPDDDIQYSVEELPEICEIGRSVRPWISFQTAKQTAGTFDLVFASGSVQYVENWEAEFARLAGLSKRYFFLTRAPIVHRSPSTIVRQRIPHGHMTGWVWQDREVRRVGRELGLQLTQFFVFHEGKTQISGLEEPVSEVGYLFSRRPV